jgi:hypothetical protein
MTEHDKSQDLKDLARGLDELTEERGPLVRLIREVDKSNKLALRNVRLQVMSLIALFLCLACLLFLAFIFYQGLGKLSQSEAHVAELAAQLTTVQNSVGEVRSEVKDAPKIVADNRGKLKVIANVQIPDDFGMGGGESGNVAKAEREVNEALDKLGVASAAAAESRKTKRAKKVEIPLDVGEASEK